MPTPSAPSPTPVVAVTVDLEDFSALGARGLAITRTARQSIAEDATGLAYRLTPDATPAEVNSELGTLLRGVLADILGPRGLYVDIDSAAATGEVFMTPLGSVPQRAAMVRITPVDEHAVTP